MKRLISLVLSLCMVLGMGAVFASAETPVAYIHLDGSPLNITDTGYTIGGNTVAFTGDYFISGNASQGIYFKSEGTYNVTVHDLNATSDMWCSSLTLDENVTLNLTVIGVNKFIAHNHPGIGGSGDAGKVNLTVAENSSVEFGSSYLATGVAVKDGITLAMADGTSVPGTDAEGWNDNNLVISNGTPAAHNLTYSYIDDNTCGFACTICGDMDRNTSHVASGVAEVEGGHQNVCVNCKHGFGEAEAHDIYYGASAEGCVPGCNYCSYEGDPISHDMSEWYADGEYCINYCYNCGYEADGAAHEITESAVEAGGIEAAHLLYACDNCDYELKEYDPETAVIIEMRDDFDDGWNGAAMMLYVDGEPVELLTLQTGSHGYFGMIYDTEKSYALQWISGGSFPEEIGIAVFTPDSESAVFEVFDMTSYGLGIIWSSNLADYSELDAAMAEIPLFLEGYTAESVNALVEALKTVQYMLPASEQEGVDAMAEAISDAVDGLVLAGEGDTSSRGVINMSNGANIYVDPEGYTDGDDSFYYEHTGKYVLFGGTDEGMFFTDGEYEIDFINLTINGYEGNVGFYDVDSAEITLCGLNMLASQSYSGYAGLEIAESNLTIKESDGTLIAIGDDDCAGIGSYYDGEGVNAGNITIDGGNIYAVSTGDGAGIGGGYCGGFETITINGGNIRAECLEDDGAGIGVGDDGYGGDIIINGGNVTALSLDDDGAGIGGADNGYVNSITINGGNIVVGSQDGAGIGGGEEADSHGGKITINGGVISAHKDHSETQNLIGNGNSESAGETEYNFVQINGGIIITDGTTGVSPAPKNANGDELIEFSMEVHECYANKEITLELSDGTEVKTTVYGTSVGVYIPADTTVTNADKFLSEFIFGDVNGDNNVDMYDYMMIKSIYFSRYEPSDEELERANIYAEDDVINMYDYMVLKSVILSK